VTNVGSIATTSASARGLLIQEGNPGPWNPFPMMGPTKLVGDGDDLFEPGEVWQWEDTATIDSDAYFDVEVSMDPVMWPGSHWGFHARSEMVRVISP
jgi:hypothetical protein